MTRPTRIALFYRYLPIFGMAVSGCMMIWGDGRTYTSGCVLLLVNTLIAGLNKIADVVHPAIVVDGDHKGSVHIEGCTFKQWPKP